MSTLWPWLAVAGAGALHGLNPCNGWLFAAATGIRSRDPQQALRALAPIAVGHAASVLAVAAAVMLGVALNRVAPGILATLLIAVLGGAAAYRWSGYRLRPTRLSTTHAGLALWSFMMSTLQGAGLMLVPALMPLCLSSSPAREITASGSLLLAMAAVGVHMATMLAVTGAAAALACRGAGAGACTRRWNGKRR